MYLYLLTYLTGHNSWFYGLGLPIVLLVTAVVEAVTFCIRKLPMSFLTGALYRSRESLFCAWTGTSDRPVPETGDRTGMVGYRADDLRDRRYHHRHPLS